jgi:hypothetical protein
LPLGKPREEFKHLFERNARVSNLGGDIEILADGHRRQHVTPLIRLSDIARSAAGQIDETSLI